MAKSKAPTWVWIVAAIPRIIVLLPSLWRPEVPLTGDALGYWTLARNLIRLGHYTLSTTPETFRPPGYPIFLLPFAALLQTPGLAVPVAQSAIGVATVVLAWRWINAWMGSRAAGWTALILSFDLTTLLHTPLILNEIVYEFLAVAALFWTWRSINSAESQKSPFLIAAGVFWSLMTIVKPIAFYLPLLIGFVWFSRKRFWLIFLISSYLLPLAWIMRNKVSTGHAEFSSAGGFALLRYPAAGVESLRTGRPMSQLQLELPAKIDQEYKGTYSSDADQGSVYTKVALRIIGNHPILLLRYCIGGSIKVLGGAGLEMLRDWAGSRAKTADDQSPRAEVTGHGTIDLLKQNQWLTPVEIIYLLGLALLYAAALLGLVRLIRFKQSTEGFVLAATTFYLLAIASIEGYYRFRIPLMPPLSALASAILLRRDNNTASK